MHTTCCSTLFVDEAINAAPYRKVARGETLMMLAMTINVIWLMMMSMAFGDDVGDDDDAYDVGDDNGKR